MPATANQRPMLSGDIQTREPLLDPIECARIQTQPGAELLARYTPSQRICLVKLLQHLATPTHQILPPLCADQESGRQKPGWPGCFRLRGPVKWNDAPIPDELSQRAR